MKNPISKAVSIIALATSISAIAPDYTLAKEKKPMGASTKHGNALISEVAFPAFKRARTVQSTSNSRRSSAYGNVDNIDAWVGAATATPGKSSTRSVTNVRSTSNNRQSSYGQTRNLSIATSEVFELNTLAGNVPRSRGRRSAFNQPEQLPSSVSVK